MANADFSEKVDHFGAAGSVLAIKSSSEGLTRNVAEACELCVFTARDIGGTFKAPVCTYAVKAEGTVSFILGKSFGAFMLVAVELRTTPGQPPVVVFRGAPNEGANAVKTHSCSFKVSPRSKAQDVAGAFEVPAGVKLHEVTTTWSAEPVVVVDQVERTVNGSKKTVLEVVASDIQHGRVTVEASSFGGALKVKSGWDEGVVGDPSREDLAYAIRRNAAMKSLS